MSKFQFVVSIVLKLIAVMFTVLFIIQVTEMILEENRFVFFQILLSFIWFCGAALFWITGFASRPKKTELGKVNHTEEKDVE